jgi:hypothetical protein
LRRILHQHHITVPLNNRPAANFVLFLVLNQCGFGVTTSIG